MTCLFKIWRTVTGLSLQCSEQETNNNKQKQKHPVHSVIINFKEKKLLHLKIPLSFVHSRTHSAHLSLITQCTSGIKWHTSSTVKVHHLINMLCRKCDEHSSEGHTVNEHLVQIRRSGHSMYQLIGKNRLMYPSYPSNFNCCTVTQQSAMAFEVMGNIATL